MTFASVLDAALDAGVVRPAILLRLLLDAGHVRVWTGLGDLVALGVVWKGLGQVTELPELEQLLNGQAARMAISLSGIDQDVVMAAVEEAAQVQGREIEILLALFDKSGALIDAPQYLDVGVMDQVSFRHDADGGRVVRTISLEFASPLAARSVAPLSYLTDRDQRARYPTDRGCEYVESYQNREIVWNPD